MELRFCRSHAHSKLSTLEEVGRIGVIVIYVDDLIITSSHKQILGNFMDDLIRDRSRISLLFCGFEVMQTHEGIFLPQSSKDVLRYFNDLKWSHLVLSLHHGSECKNLCDASMYHKIAQSHLWLTHTKLDIDYCACVMCSFSTKPHFSFSNYSLCMKVLTEAPLFQKIWIQIDR